MATERVGIRGLFFGRRAGAARSRRLRLLRRLIVLPLALGLIGYAALPWWLPTDWLRGQIVGQLQRDLRRPVSIDRIEVSWAGGVVLHDLRVRQHERFGEGDLFRAERITCPFNPLTTLWSGRIERLEIANARLDVIRNPDGELNVSEGDLPESSLKVGRIVFTGARVMLINRRSGVTAEVPLGTVSLRTDAGGGVLMADLSGRVAYSEGDSGPRDLGRFSVHARLFNPFADSPGADPPRQGGQLLVRFRAVDLASLTVGDWNAARRIGLTHLAGQCGGTLSIELDEQGRLAWRLATDFENLDVRLEQAPGGVKPASGRMDLAGLYDTPSGHNRIDRVALAVPGLELSAGVEFHPGPGRLRLQIDQAVVRPEALSRTVPDLPGWLAGRAQVSGQVGLSGRIEWGDLVIPRDVDLTVEATDLAVHAPGLIDKPAGVPGLLRVQAGYQPDLDKLRIAELSVRLDGSELTLIASADQLYPLTTGAMDVWSVWLDWMGHLVVRTPHAERLQDLLPVLRRALGRANLSGPGGVAVRFEPIAEQVDWQRRVLARRLGAAVWLGAGSRLTVPGDEPDAPLIDKRTDEPLSLTLDMRFESDPAPEARESVVVRTGSLLLRLGGGGDGSEAWASDATASAQADRPADGSGADPDGSAVLEVAPFAGRFAVVKTPGSADGPRFESYLDLTARPGGRRLERLIELSPLLKRRMGEQGVELGGGFVAREAGLNLGPREIRAWLDLALDGLDLRIDSPRWAAETPQAAPDAARDSAPDSAQIQPVLVKRPGEPVRVRLDYASYPVDGSADRPGGHYESGRIVLAGLGVDLVAERSTGQADGPTDLRRLDVTVADAAALLSHSPALAAQVDQQGRQVSGSARVAAVWRPGRRHVFDIELDGTDLDVRPAKCAASRPPDHDEARPSDPALGWLGHKPAGMPLTLVAQARTDLPNEPAQPSVEVTRGRLVVGGNQLDLTGSIRLLPVWWGEAGRADLEPARRLGAWMDITRPPPVDQVDLTVQSRLRVDPQTRALLPAMAERLDDWGVRGGAGLSARISGGWRQLRVQADIDAQDAAVTAPGRVIKLSGVPARLAVDVTVSPRLELWTVHRLSGQLADMRVEGAGQVLLRPDRLRPANYALDLSVTVPDLGRLARLCPAVLSRPRLLAGPLSGRLVADLHLFADEAAESGAEYAPVARPRLLPSTLEFSDVRLTLAGAPLAADGQVELSDRSVFTPRLTVRVGDSHAAVAARVNDPLNRPTGWIDLAGQSLDVDQLTEFWSRLQSLPESAGAGAEVAADAPPASDPKSPDGEPAREIVAFLARCELAGRAHLANVFVSDPKSQTRYELAELTTRFTLDQGRVDVPFQTALAGGTLTGQLQSDLTEPDPMLDIRYEAYRLFPTESVQPLVEAFFPGMTIHGHVTMTEHSRQKLLPGPDEPNWPVGRGEIIFEDGLLVGQAGPDWMVRVFPGLKLTQYRFRRMHNWFELTADGNAEHHMIFDGTAYDIYMIGYTHRGTGKARYEVGVDLLASLDSKTWSVDLRQGKIPLMYVSGTIRNRELEDPEFRMVPPPIALWQMLLRDNILYRGVIERAIKAARKDGD